MNKDIRKIDDNELENVTGGTGTAIDGSGRDGSSKEGGKDAGKDAGKYAGGGICPLNGKYCKHGRVNRSGECHHALEGIGIKNGQEYTFYECHYINDQE